MELTTFLRQRAAAGLVPWPIEVEAAAQFGLTCHAVEESMLEAGLLPARYQRNRQMLTVADQLRLLRSRVVVVGCGGLGGYAIEELARLGVGEIVAIDPDHFEEHNLNRQLLSSPARLGQAKVQAAAERVAEINPAVLLTPLQLALTQENGMALLAGAQIAVDGLDTISARCALAACCNAAQIPVVHAAIAGWYGQITTQFPDEEMMQRFCGEETADRGIEKELGNPAFTPALLASIQVADACKVLLGRGVPLRRRLLQIDLLDMEVEEISM